MVITFLGTSAANAYPEAFCRCENCQKARALGGPSLRKRSAGLVNDDLLIDLGPDVMSASQMHGISLTGVRYCLQTHAHADHLDPSHFLSRSPAFEVVGAPRLHFYASPATARRTAQLLERDCAPDGFLDPQVGERLNLEVHQVEPLQSFTVGSYRVTALPANHDPAVEPLLYAVEGEGGSIFYGTDTAVLPEETWRAFHRQEMRFDVVILDHTYGPDEGAGSGDEAEHSDHLSAYQVMEHVARMREEGILADGGHAFATHISHPGNPVHPELVAFAARHGYDVAYDGLAVRTEEISLSSARTSRGPNRPWILEGRRKEVE
jgi:phosphoribosyl 1,2-cyclic phosphate phosphodiesterase